MPRDSERERELRESLRRADVPDAGPSERRALELLERAFGERESTAPRRRLAPRGLGVLMAAGATALIALSPAGAEVRDWISSAVDPGEKAAERPAGSLPARGSLLVEASGSLWIMREDGSRRRLGDYERGSWSPHGLFVAAASGGELSALEPDGDVRWRLAPQPGPIGAIAWSPDPGYRVAYLANGDLRVVAGDGTGDRRVSGAVAPVAPRWRPRPGNEPAHQIAYVDRRNRAVLADLDSGRVLWRSARVAAAVRSLQFSAAGDRLLLVADGFSLIFDGRGKPLAKGPVAAGAAETTLAPDGSELALVRATARGGSALAIDPLPAAAAREGERRLYTTSAGLGPGGFEAPVFSPDGRTILLPWRQADQWLFVPVNGGRVTAFGAVSGQFDSGDGTAERFLRIAGWCC